MPSPFAHLSMGYLIYRIARKRPPEDRRLVFGKLPVLLIVVLAASLLPDADSILAVITGDFLRFHNNETHSLVTGLFVSAIAASILNWKWRSGYSGWFFLILLSYEMHVIMDFFTRGRGVMLLWPFSTERFSSQLLLFTGLRWSEGLFSPLHFVTLANELVFAVFLFLLLSIRERRKDEVKN